MVQNKKYPVLDKKAIGGLIAFWESKLFDSNLLLDSTSRVLVEMTIMGLFELGERKSKDE